MGNGYFFSSTYVLLLLPLRIALYTTPAIAPPETPVAEILNPPLAQTAARKVKHY
jgi:hypothetical protein